MRVTIVVIDGFGIGAMPDAGGLRAGDIHADTLKSLVRWSADKRHRQLRIPTLAANGLHQLRPDLDLTSGQARGHVSFCRAGLGYPGADTFAGHQTMMGADMSRVVVCPLRRYAAQVEASLRTAGHDVRVLADGGLLLVDGEVLVHDNLEADPGINWNVSGRLNHVSWKVILEVAEATRMVAPVARVIAVGGFSDEPLTSYVRDGDNGTIGMDTPASGFYRHDGLRVRHLGTDLDHRHQLPEVAAAAGRSVALVGKTADILETDTPVTRLPGVETPQLLAATLDVQRTYDLVVTNIQQTDLAGHQQDAEMYAGLIETVDAALHDLIDQLASDDVLIVTADHGNDPLIGHAFHTREFVPVLTIHGSRSTSDARPRCRPALQSLADIGASAAQLLGLDPHEIGHGAPRELVEAD